MRRKMTAAALGIVLTLMLAGIVGAYPAIEDTARTTSLKVYAASEGTPISGVRFTLFRAADMTITESGTVKFELTKPFAAYNATEANGGINANLDPNAFDSSNWASAAETMAPFVVKDAASGKAFEMTSAVTGEDGTASFSGLSQGLYLMTSLYEGTAYTSVTATPVFLTLPLWDGSAWKYDAAVNGKITATKTPTPNETPKEVSVTAKKVWSGDDSATASKNRPASVTVELTNAAGQVVDTQILSAENGWAFTWTGLDEGQWSVTEKEVPAGYSASLQEEVTADGKTVTITNTKPPAGVLGESREKEKESEETEEMESEEDTEKEAKKGSGVKGSNRPGGRQGDTGSVASSTRLPQTGQLWWPIWLLAGIAAVLVILGLALRLSGKRDLKD